MLATLDTITQCQCNHLQPLQGTLLLHNIELIQCCLRIVSIWNYTPCFRESLEPIQELLLFTYFFRTEGFNITQFKNDYEQGLNLNLMYGGQWHSLLQSVLIYLVAGIL